VGCRVDILVVGLNHKTAPLEIRERLHFRESLLPSALERLKEVEGVSEGMILSTCNRIEVYAGTDRPEQSVTALDRFLGEFHTVPLDAYHPFLYRHIRRDAVRHLFRVTSSLDSMVVGEPQIVGQVKCAFQSALEMGAAGNALQHVMDRALGVAKRVRNETAVAASAVSVSYAAVELTRRIFGEMEDHRVMLVGASEMGRLAARHLISRGVRRVMVANRSYEKAVAMAREFDGSPVPLRRLEEHLADVDVVISCTSSPDYVIRYEHVARAMRRRRHRPIFLVDIAVPRDIDPAVHGLDNVYLYNIDDLKQVVEENLRMRQGEAARAEEIVESEVEAFDRWLRQREIAPTIKALQERVEGLRLAEMERIKGRLSGLGPEEKEAVEEATRRLVNKILHKPLRGIKDALNHPDSAARVERIRKLFGLGED